MRILTVCTHNRTRSVLAAGLLRHKLQGIDREVVVESAGFGPEGKPPMPEAAEMLLRVQQNVSSHVSRRATGAVVFAADLIVAAERQHVVRLVVEEGADFRRVFTLPELRNRLDALGPLPPGDLETALNLLNEGRQRGGAYLRTEVPEVTDPTGGSAARWERVWTDIDDACTRVVAFVSRLTG